MTLRSDLRLALREFDGNAVSLLSETAAKLSGKDDFIPACLDLIGDDEPLIQRGASWIWLDHVRARGTIPADELSALTPQLNNITDWAAALHLLQALDFYDGSDIDLARYAEFISAYLKHKRPFLRAWSVSALCRLAAFHDGLRPEAEAALQSARSDPAASVRARTRKIVL